MKRALILVASLAAAAGLLAVGAVMAGVVPFLGNGDSGRPPCDQLATEQEATDALDRNAELVTQITSVGDGVSVGISTPCGNADQALVSVRYRTDMERSGVHNILRDGDGFGVPVELIKGG